MWACRPASCSTPPALRRRTASSAWPDSRLKPKRDQGGVPGSAMLTRMATLGRSPSRRATASAARQLVEVIEVDAGAGAEGLLQRPLRLVGTVEDHLGARHVAQRLVELHLADHLGQRALPVHHLADGVEVVGLVGPGQPGRRQPEPTKASRSSRWRDTRVRSLKTKSGEPKRSTSAGHRDPVDLGHGPHAGGPRELVHEPGLVPHQGRPLVGAAWRSCGRSWRRAARPPWRAPGGRPWRRSGRARCGRRACRPGTRSAARPLAEGQPHHRPGQVLAGAGGQVAPGREARVDLDEQVAPLGASAGSPARRGRARRWRRRSGAAASRRCGSLTATPAQPLPLSVRRSFFMGTAPTMPPRAVAHRHHVVLLAGVPAAGR